MNGNQFNGNQYGQINNNQNQFNNNQGMNQNMMDDNREEKRNKGFIFSENKGRGLFYGVIAIATFIVMAVGATFAYFTATTASMNSAVQTGSTTLQLKYISYSSAWSKRDLIPADTSVVEYSVEVQNDTTNSSKANDQGVFPVNGNNTMCKDDFGNSICSIYVFQVKNSAPSPQSVSINVISEKNGFASLNAMAYEIAEPTEESALAIYNKIYDASNEETFTEKNGINDPVFRDGSDDENEDAIDVIDEKNALLDKEQYRPVYINRAGVVKTLLEYIDSTTTDGDTVTVVKKPALDRVLVSLPNPSDESKEAEERTAKIADDIKIEGGELKTFALVLYIKNANYDQTDTDADKIFQGQVVVTSGDGSTGVSGTISAFGKTEEENLQSNVNTPAGA